MVNKTNKEKPTNENKPPFYKRGWFIGLAGMVIGVAIVGTDDEETAQESETQDVVEAPTETEEEVVVEEPEVEEEADEDIVEEESVEKEVAEEEEEVIEDMVEEIEESAEIVSLDTEVDTEDDRQTLLDATLLILEAGPLSEQGYFYYQEEMDAFVYVPTDPDLSTAFGLIAVGLLEEEYDVMRSSFLSLSETIYQSSSTGLVIANPENEENILLWAIDGIIMYDFVDDL